MPTIKVTGSMIKAAWGFVAMRRKAASPIVLISAASTPPKETTFLVNKLITIIAPPQPGITPNIEQIGISNFLFCKINFCKLKFLFSRITNRRSVTPTKLDTAM